MTINATPAKLRSGEWGARVQSDTVSIGDTIQITTRAGKSWPATVSQVIWRGKGITLVATGKAARKPAASRPMTAKQQRQAATRAHNEEVRKQREAAKRAASAPAKSRYFTCESCGDNYPIAHRVKDCFGDENMHRA